MLIAAIKHAIDLEEDDRDPSKISISSLGQCGRKLAYRKHKIAGIPLDYKAKANFDDGNFAHAQIRPWIRRGLLQSKSCYRLVDQEKDVVLSKSGIEIGGHIDGFLKHRNSKCDDTSHDDMLLEVKSMNEIRFKNFKLKDEVDYEYRCQVNGYLVALGLHKARVLAKNKNKFDLHEAGIARDDALVELRMGIVAQVQASTNPETVAKEHEPDKYGILPWQCNYCPFVTLCWRHEGVSQIKDKLYKVLV